MPRKGERKARVPVGDPSDAQGFAALLNKAANLVEIVRVWDNRQDPRKLRLP